MQIKPFKFIRHKMERNKFWTELRARESAASTQAAGAANDWSAHGLGNGSSL